MSCSMEIIKFYEECEMEELIKIKNNYNNYNINVGHGGDYYKFDKNTSIDEVKEKCKEFGSRLFVAKHN